MLLPPYCPEDPGGPLSQADALKLLRLMQQRFAEQVYENQTAKGDSLTFQHASGSSEALLWCVELLERVEIDPEYSRQAMLESAKALENMAKRLRYRAGEIDETA